MKKLFVFIFFLSFSLPTEAQYQSGKNIVTSSATQVLISTNNIPEKVKLGVNYNRMVYRNFGFSVGYSRVETMGEQDGIIICDPIFGGEHLFLEESIKHTFNIAATYALEIEHRHILSVGLGVNHNQYHFTSDYLSRYSNQTLFSKADYYYQLFKSVLIGGSVQIENHSSVNVAAGLNFGLMF